jgi:hypothetical protein
MLARIIGKPRMAVNSAHHQAVASIGDGGSRCAAARRRWSRAGCSRICSAGCDEQPRKPQHAACREESQRFSFPGATLFQNLGCMFRWIGAAEVGLKGAVP